MIRSHSVTDLFRKIKKSYLAAPGKVFLVLIGGCSRSGKSTLSRELSERIIEEGIGCTVVNLDAWLIDVDERKAGSTVSERYEMAAVNTAIEGMIKGEEIFPPVYDPISRKRVKAADDKPVYLTSGILILEGVITLGDAQLVKKAGVTIFVEIPDTLRLNRLFYFYENVKRLPKTACEQIIAEREKEEIPFIKNTAENAHIFFSHRST